MKHIDRMDKIMKTLHPGSFRGLICISVCVLWRTAAGEAAPATQGSWKVEPEKVRGVFPAGEDADFVLEGGSGRPTVKILDLQGQEAGKPEIQEISPGRLRLAVKGLRAGHHRLFLDAAASSTGAADAAPAGAPLSFAVLPEIRTAARGAEGAISCDAAISWLVARRGSSENPVANPRPKQKFSSIVSEGINPRSWWIKARPI